MNTDYELLNTRVTPIAAEDAENLLAELKRGEGDKAK